MFESRVSFLLDGHLTGSLCVTCALSSLRVCAITAESGSRCLWLRPISESPLGIASVTHASTPLIAAVSGPFTCLRYAGRCHNLRCHNCSTGVFGHDTIAVHSPSRSDLGAPTTRSKPLSPRNVKPADARSHYSYPTPKSASMQVP